MKADDIVEVTMDVSAEQGNMQVVMAGDLKGYLECFLAVQDRLHNNAWTDLGGEESASGGGAAHHTCHDPNAIKPSTGDYVLVIAGLAEM